MKINRIKVFGVILTVLTVYAACRKIDYSPTKPDKNAGNQFFSAHLSLNETVLAVQGYMKRENVKYNFADSIVERIGLPRWDKALVLKDVTLKKYQRSATEETGTIVYLPFVKTGEYFVNAILEFSMTQLDTSWKGICDWQYSQLGFDSVPPNSSRLNAREAFFVFANLDRAVFGYTEFEVTDGQIFYRNPTDTFDVSATQPGQGNKNNILHRSGSAGTQSCIGYFICGRAAPARANRANIVPGEQCYHQTWCETPWEEYGNGWWPGEQGGGGGNYVPPPEPPCPPVQNRGLNATPNCPPRGWNSIPPGNPPPPPNDSTIAANLKKLYLKGQQKADSLFTKAMEDTLERTFTFIRTDTDTLPMFFIAGTKYTSKPTLAYSYFAIWHSHQDEGPANRNQCFDGPDIYKQYYHVLNNETVGVSIITTHDYIYAAVITNPNLFKNYIHQICGSTRDDDVYYGLDDLFNTAANNCNGCSFQEKSEAGTLAITANNNSQTSGIKIFKSPRTNVNFTPLTP